MFKVKILSKLCDLLFFFKVLIFNIGPVIDEKHIHYYIIVPPQPASLRIVSTTPDSITVQWESNDDGYSPITRALLNYKMTYGEWADTEVCIFFVNFEIDFRLNNS